MRYIQIVAILASSLLLFSSFTFKDEKISLNEAIKLAEKFVSQNGFTKKAPDKSKIFYELFESNDELEMILKNRYNSLQPKAFCYGEDKNRQEFHIGFLSAQINQDQLSEDKLKIDLPGKAVIVNFKGDEIKIAHKDPLFSTFIKLK